VILKHKDPETALILGVENERAVLRFIRNHPDAPFSKRGKTWFTVQEHLEAWIASGYSDAAKQALKEGQCTSDGTRKPGSEKAIGTSALAELERRLGPQTGRRRRPSNTSSTPRLGIVATG
jgi:hypothetical protein